jgi:hypothetical protein
MRFARIADKTSDWPATALVWAREAWTHDRSRRNGLYLVQAFDGDAGYFVIYNNHPDMAFPHLRAQELDEIRGRLSAAGIAELAYATHPHPEGGYTYALVLAVGAGWEGVVEGLVSDAMDVCWRRRAASGSSTGPSGSSSGATAGPSSPRRRRPVSSPRRRRAVRSK